MIRVVASGGTKAKRTRIQTRRGARIMEMRVAWIGLVRRRMTTEFRHCVMPFYSPKLGGNKEEAAITTPVLVRPFANGPNLGWIPEVEIETARIISFLIIDRITITRKVLLI